MTRQEFVSTPHLPFHSISVEPPAAISLMAPWNENASRGVRCFRHGKTKVRGLRYGGSRISLPIGDFQPFLRADFASGGGGGRLKSSCMSRLLLNATESSNSLLHLSRRVRTGYTIDNHGWISDYDLFIHEVHKRKGIFPVPFGVWRLSAWGLTPSFTHSSFHSSNQKICGASR